MLKTSCRYCPDTGAGRVELSELSLSEVFVRLTVQGKGIDMGQLVLVVNFVMDHPAQA